MSSLSEPTEIDETSNVSDQVSDLEVPSQGVIETVLDTDLDTEIANYAECLKALDIENPSEKFTLKLGLDILIARDALQVEMEKSSYLPSEMMMKISPLDQQLYTRRDLVLSKVDLEQWRLTANPSPDHWWWYLLPVVEKPEWSKFDWIWTLLSILFLVGTVTLMIQILPIIAGNGLSIFESFTLVGPGAMATIVGSSLRGGEGKNKFIQTMAKLKIPSYLCSEVTCLIAGLLFGGSLVARRYLPDHYFQLSLQEGETSYRESKLLEAEKSFKIALKVPDRKPEAIARVYNNLGLVYESTGRNDEAIDAYTVAVQMGNKPALNNMGRVYIAKEDLPMAETYLKMGLERTKKQPEASDYLLQYKLRRNLGWVYLEGKRYPEAERELKTAVDISKEHLSSETVGIGIASCFLGNLYDLTERKKESEPYWERCRTIAKPETIAEYSVIVKLKPDIAEFIPTSNIF
ncbi:MAG: tetratricopeptide repeat protein [Pseudanabaenaceae cyanobacterium]